MNDANELLFIDTYLFDSITIGILVDRRLGRLCARSYCIILVGFVVAYLVGDDDLRIVCVYWRYIYFYCRGTLFPSFISRTMNE